MGIIYSSERRNSSRDFEEVLSKLDTDIRKVEGRLSEIKIKQRKTSFLWIIYSIVIWILCVLYLFYLFLNEIHQKDIIYGGIPAILLPIGIYHVRKLIVWWFDQRTKKEELKLAALRKEQKDKLEDLKKKTSYYTTQSLIEKYDESIAKKKKELEEIQRQQQQQQNKQKPMSMPANMNKHKIHMPHPHVPHLHHADTMNRNIPAAQQQAANTPNNLPPSPPYVHLQNQHQHPQQPQEVHWYDKIVDALVGDIGPESKYALVCNHCYSHNGLVFKEEYDTIQYVCPVCKQFNPSRKSKQQQVSSQVAAAAAAAADGKSSKTSTDDEHEVNDVAVKAQKNPADKDDDSNPVEDEDDEEVLAKLKAEYMNDDNSISSIGSRVRQRRQYENLDSSDQDM